MDPEVEIRRAATAAAGKSPRPALRVTGFPWKSSLFAALFSVAFLTLIPPLAIPLLDALFPMTGAGPFTIVIFSFLGLMAAIVASALFSVLSLTAMMAQFHWRLSDRTVAILAFPAAWVVVLPSVLVDLPSWFSWFAFATLAAIAFAIHWCVFAWAREVFD